jgi:hypothetical protein
METTFAFWLAGFVGFASPGAIALAGDAQAQPDPVALTTGPASAYELSGDTSLLFRLGELNREIGSDVAAARFYRTYLAREPRGKDRDAAERAARRLEPGTPLPAQPLQYYPILGVEVRNGDIVALQLGAMRVFGSSANPVVATARGEIGVGGSGAGVGLVIASGTDSPNPDPKDLIFGGFILLELRAERMYGPTSWSHTTYAGPQVTFYPFIAPKVSLGWMADVHDAANNRLQIGVGGGF